MQVWKSNDDLARGRCFVYAVAALFAFESTAENFTILNPRVARLGGQKKPADMGRVDN